MKEELIKEMEHNLSLVMDYDEYQEDCGYGDQSYVEFEYDKMAKELIDMGWTKIVWHKVADGDLPKNYRKVAFIAANYEYYIGTYIKKDEAFETYIGFGMSKDHFIAWIELPKYEE
jgi:hypothetical protein